MKTYKSHTFVPAGQSVSGKYPCRICGKERSVGNHTNKDRKVSQSRKKASST